MAGPYPTGLLQKTYDFWTLLFFALAVTIGASSARSLSRCSRLLVLATNTPQNCGQLIPLPREQFAHGLRSA